MNYHLLHIRFSTCIYTKTGVESQPDGINLAEAARDGDAMARLFGSWIAEVQEPLVIATTEEAEQPIGGGQDLCHTDIVVVISVEKVADRQRIRDVDGACCESGKKGNVAVLV